MTIKIMYVNHDNNYLNWTKIIYSVSQATEVHTNLLYQNNQLQKRTSLD
ncbi:hypothetical protein NIES2107_58350 [Nostoc carneum NIES-2107]|nr:hypothetical protein NIES2107_58350 [Nostoc carneum NIES-2107]